MAAASTGKLLFLLSFSLPPLIALLYCHCFAPSPPLSPLCFSTLAIPLADRDVRKLFFFGSYYFSIPGFYVTICSNTSYFLPFLLFAAILCVVNHIFLCVVAALVCLSVSASCIPFGYDHKIPRCKGENNYSNIEEEDGRQEGKKDITLVCISYMRGLFVSLLSAVWTQAHRIHRHTLSFPSHFFMIFFSARVIPYRRYRLTTVSVSEATDICYVLLEPTQPN